MAKYKALDNFTISSKPVTVSFAHAGVFTPPIPGTLEIHTFPASIDPSRRLAYRDSQAYAKEHVVEAVSPQSKTLPSASAVTPNTQSGPQGNNQLPGEKLKISLKKRKRDPTNEGSSKKASQPVQVKSNNANVIRYLRNFNNGMIAKWSSTGQANRILRPLPQVQLPH